jgi:hypothetical protein
MTGAMVLPSTQVTIAIIVAGVASFPTVCRLCQQRHKVNAKPKTNGDAAAHDRGHMMCQSAQNGAYWLRIG